MKLKFSSPMHPLIFLILCVLLNTIILVLLTFYSAVIGEPRQSLIDVIYVSIIVVGFIGFISSAIIVSIITGLYILIRTIFKKSIYVSKLMAIFMFVLSLILTFAVAIIWASVIGSNV